MKKFLMVLAVAACLVPVISPAQGAGAMKVLGTDVSLDAPPGSDLVSLAAALHDSDLHIQISFANPVPVQGSYPNAGIEWIFDVRGRTYSAEAHPEPGGNFRFTLYEVIGGAFNQLATLDGDFDDTTGILDMYVPLREIGAKKGTVISGTGAKGTEDLQFHQHAGPASPLLDTLATTKDFVVR